MLMASSSLDLLWKGGEDITCIWQTIPTYLNPAPDRGGNNFGFRCQKVGMPGTVVIKLV
jgi:hypothetical protein